MSVTTILSAVCVCVCDVFRPVSRFCPPLRSIAASFRSPVFADGREHLQLTIRMGKEVQALFAERCFSEAFPPALDLLTGELVGE